MSEEGKKPDYVGLSNLGTTNLDYAKDTLEKKVRGESYAIIAHAGDNMDVAAQRANAALKYHGVKSTVVLHERDPKETKDILKNIDGVFIMGGNAFSLVVNMAAMRNPDGSLIDKRPKANTEAMDGYLKEQAEKGLVIVGVSAGLQIMGKDVRTSPDPRNYVAKDGSIETQGLNLLPFNFHPHFEPKNDAMNKELEMYPQVDPSVRIIAVEDRSFITFNNGEMKFHGQGGALFESNKVQPIQADQDLTPLLK